MVEVFKTNVNHPDHARKLLEQIHKTWHHYRANFDLDDCDRILRVKALHGAVCSGLLINLVKQSGFYAEVLKDE